jgi:hypothetical protein
MDIIVSSVGIAFVAVTRGRPTLTHEGLTRGYRVALVMSVLGFLHYYPLAVGFSR